jgi:serine/threonine-protein kinase
VSQDDLLARWPEAERIVDGLLDLPPEKRRQRVRDDSALDPALRSIVERLLDEAERDEPLVAPGIVEAASSPDDEPLPEQVGPYRVLGQLGRGGMGLVLRTVREGSPPPPPVALKLLDVRARSEEARRRFDRERETMARLEHPNIARLLDGGVAESGAPYLVMELVDGRPINAFCDENRLDVAARIQLFLQVCAAVEYAHSRFVVHRDLKPANVLVDRFGQARLLDFGIAKWLDQLEAAHLTQTAHRVLTPAHAAPEQFRGDPVTAATDVYQLGLLLYELLTGRRAHGHADSTSEALQRAVLDTDPEQPSRAVLQTEDEAARAPQPAEIAQRRASTTSALSRHLAGDLDAIVLKALRKEPASRYATVEALRRDLEAYLSHRPVSARRGSRVYVIQKYARRHRAGVAAAAGVTLALAAGLVGVAAQSRVTAQERDRARAAEAGASAINSFLVEELLTAQTPAKAQGRPLSVADVLGNASRSVGYAFANQPRLEVDVRSTLARSYLALGELAEARRHATAARDMLLRSTAQDPLAELRARTLLARVTLEEGHYTDARRELETIAAAQEALGGTTHHDTLTTRLLLAGAMRKESEATKAEPIVRSALVGATALIPFDWRLEADLQTELAYILLDRGKGLEADSLIRGLLDLQRSHLGPAHPDVLRTLVLQGNALTVLAKHNAALEVKLQALALHEEVYGRDHPETARALNQVAVTLEQLDREGDARPYVERAYEIYKRAFGPEHPNTIISLRNVGILYGRLPDGFSKAEPIYRQVLDVRRRTLGEQHADTIEAGLNLASLYTRAGRAGEARAAGRDVIRQCEGVAARPDAEPLTLDKCADYYLRGDPSELHDPLRALSLAERAVKAEGRTHYARLATLARAHQALGQPAEAIAILREALALPAAIQSWSTEALLVDLLREHGTPEELERWLLDRLDQFRRLRGPDDHFMAYTLRHLARLYAREGRAQEAEARFAERLAQLRKRSPETNWQVAQARTELGEQITARGGYAEAEPLLLGGMKDLQADPYVTDAQLEDARARIVKLYTAWTRPADADAWKRRALR